MRSVEQTDLHRESNVASWLEERRQLSEVATPGNHADLPDPEESGDDHFDQIWHTYHHQLVKFARIRLAGLPRRDADEEDVAMSAMNSFYRGVSEGRLPRLSDPDDLWKILLTITARKASKRIRYHNADKRGNGKVRGDSVFEREAARGNGVRGFDHIIAEEPTPETAEEVIDQCGEMLEQLEDDTLARIAVMKLEGFTNEEIADELNCAVRTVERKLFRIRMKWERLVNAHNSEDTGD